MTRMSREFSLVLLGAGLLTAGYFMWPEKDFEKRAEEQAKLTKETNKLLAKAFNETTTVDTKP